VWWCRLRQDRGRVTGAVTTAAAASAVSETREPVTSCHGRVSGHYNSHCIRLILEFADLKKYGVLL